MNKSGIKTALKESTERVLLKAIEESKFALKSQLPKGIARLIINLSHGEEYIRSILFQLDYLPYFASDKSQKAKETMKNIYNEQLWIERRQKYKCSVPITPQTFRLKDIEESVETNVKKMCTKIKFSPESKLLTIFISAEGLKRML